jgi:hypothetical protein
MIHIKPERAGATETLCGQPLTGAPLTIREERATDRPEPGPFGRDVRCTHCWRIWRSTHDVIGPDDPEYETSDNESGMPPGWLDFDWPDV